LPQHSHISKITTIYCLTFLG